MGNSGTGVHETIVNQLLSKMDGVDSLNNILVIGMTNRKDMTSDQTTFFPSEKSYTSGNNTSDDGGSSRPSARASGMAAPSIIENRRNIASSQASLQSDSQSAESLATLFSLFSNRTVRNFVWMSVLFSANHASVVSCLALATARLA